MTFLNALTAWQWALILAVPPAIVALYFLKLRRQPVEVPSTLLWHKSLEDLHVNSPWQRIRQSLLLYLQLLIVSFFIISLLRPGWRTSELAGGRSIFLIDNSASMSATDVAPSRLAEAKRQAVNLINQLQSGDQAMVVCFSDTARIEQGFTNNHADLRQAVEQIQPTNRTTNISDALRTASGFANPSNSNTSDESSSSAPEPIKLFILSDGRFPPVPNFLLGNLEPIFVPIANSQASNVGIVAFSIDRAQGDTTKSQAFGRVENFTDREVTVPLDLLASGNPIDAATLTVPANDSAGVTFTLGNLDPGVLELRIATPDALPQDNRAWAAVNSSPRPKILLITPGNKPLELALSTPRAHELAEVTIAAPNVLKTKDHQQAAATGAYDLIIYDRCIPQRMPEANTLSIATTPPNSGINSWSLGDPVSSPQIIDSARNHPLMQWLDLGNVEIAEARPVTPPPGGTRLIDSNKGTLLAIAPRDEFEDAVLGFEISSVDKQGQPVANTNWPIRGSFPTFIYNVLQYLGGNRESLNSQSLPPGHPITLKSNVASDQLQVRTPSGTTVSVPRSPSGTFHFTATEELGPYEILQDNKITQRFTVNLFDPLESDIRGPKENSLQIGQLTVPGQAAYASVRRETWRWLLAAALVVLLLEWYIYNRRVYV